MTTLQTFTPKAQARGFIMPNFIMENNNISMGAKMLFGVLCDYARDRTFCYPSKHTLANRLNCSLNSVKNYLKQLTDIGFLKSEMSLTMKKEIFYLRCPGADLVPAQKITKENDVPPNQNLPEANEPELGAGAGEDSKNTPQKEEKNFKQGCQNLASKVSNFDPKTNVSFNSLNPPTPQRKKNKKSANLEFEKFWEMYPKKERKEDANKIWVRLSNQDKIPTLDILKKSIEYLSEKLAWYREDGQYIPHAINFIKSLRWCDVPMSVLRSTPKEKQITQKVVTFETSEKLPTQAEKEQQKLEYNKLKQYFPPLDNVQDCIALGLFTSYVTRYNIKIDIPKNKQTGSILEYIKSKKQGDIHGRK